MTISYDAIIIGTGPAGPSLAGRLTAAGMKVAVIERGKFGGVSVDMNRVKTRKDQVSGKSNAGVEAWLKNMANCTVYEGHAHFESPHGVVVGADWLSADRIFINVDGKRYHS